MTLIPLPSAKDIFELIKKGATLEAQEKIMELREMCITLQEENHNLRRRITELENILSISKRLMWEAPYYWVKSGEAKEGPFCQVCYDKEKRLIRLQNHGKGAWSCYSCKNSYFNSFYEPPEPPKAITKTRK
jgi:hypothetical protein